MTILEHHSPQQADVFVREVLAALERGTRVKETLEALPLNSEFHEEILEIAKARMSAEKTGKDFFMTGEDLRFATNELVANWRAKRLSCNRIIDLGCGIGVQSLAFAKTCKEVIGVDIDSRKVEYARANASLKNVQNAHFHCTDAVDFLKQLDFADIISWDPERPPSETARTLESLQPSFHSVVKNASRLTENIAIELPPQLQNLPEGFEAEYASVDGKLNRLTVYGGKLRQADKSVVSLPQQAQLFSTGKKQNISELKACIAEVDEGVLHAGLAGELGSVWEEDTAILTAETPQVSPFLHWWKVVSICQDSDEGVKRALNIAGAGKIVLHQHLKPEKYWKMRNILEQGLKGQKIVAVFRTGKTAVIAQKFPSNRPTA